MSVVHNIINKKPLDFSRLNNFVSGISDVLYEDRGEGTFLYWIDGKSTRGLNVTIEKDLIEVRNMVLSNRHDYELTNQIVAEIVTMTDGVVHDPEEKPISDFPLWSSDKIAETELHDCDVIRTLSREHDVSIFGAIRNVHFGKRMYETLKPLEGSKLKDAIFDLILKVNYQLPKFEPSGIMMVSSPGDDEKKKMKVITNEADYIIDKYDYILLFLSEGQPPIMITNAILNSILPSGWTLVDEYTVVAPVIEQKEWDKFLKNAQKQDLWDSYMNKAL